MLVFSFLILFQFYLYYYAKTWPATVTLHPVVFTFQFLKKHSGFWHKDQ